MSESVTTPAPAEAFVAKLNRFLATLDTQEQSWLGAFLTCPAAATDAVEDAVQGYQLLPPFALTLVPQAGFLGAPGAAPLFVAQKRADGTGGGNVAGGWDLVSNKVNA